MTAKKLELLKAFFSGAVLFGVLGMLRLPFSSTTRLSILGGYSGYLAVSLVVGGISGVVYVATANWRRAGGLRRSAAYALMGALVGAFVFVVIVSDGGHATGLAGEPIGVWGGNLLATSTMVAIVALVGRKWLDFIGVLED